MALRRLLGPLEQKCLSSEVPTQNPGKRTKPNVNPAAQYFSSKKNNVAANTSKAWKYLSRD